MLNQPFNPKLIIGSPRTGITGETIVPGAPHEPAQPCSLTTPTKPYDPYLVYPQPGKPKKLTNESLPTPPSAPRPTKNSSNTTIPKAQAAATATPQAARPTGTTARPYDARARTSVANGTTLANATTDAAKSRAPPKPSTAVKKPTAPISAAKQTKQTEIAAKPRDTRRSPHNTTGATIATDTSQSRARKPAPWTTKTTAVVCTADVFTGTLEKMPRDGSCLFHSLKLGDAMKLREQIVTWLRANPNHPYLFTTLAAYVLAESGETWSEYCDRMQHAHVWTGAPELVAAAHIYHRCIRVFANAGPGRYHLWAVLGEKSTLLDVGSLPIDIVFGANHYDLLIGARLLKPWEHNAVTPAPREPEDTDVPTAPKEPVTLSPREPKKTDVSTLPKEPEMTTTTDEHAQKIPNPVARLAAQLGIKHNPKIEPTKPAADEPREPEMCEATTVPEEPETPTCESLKVLAELAARKSRRARLAAQLGIDGHDPKIKPTEPAADEPREPEMYGATTVPKEPEAPTRELLKVLDDRLKEPEIRTIIEEVKVCLETEEPVPDAPKSVKKARSVTWKRRKTRRARDARKARKLEARQAREQREAWGRRDELRKLNQTCSLHKNLPRPEVAEWKPTFEARGANHVRTGDERANHVQLLFANIDGGAPLHIDGDAPVPPPLHVALCMLLPPTAPYMRGVAPRVFGMARSKDLGCQDSAVGTPPKALLPT